MSVSRSLVALVGLSLILAPAPSALGQGAALAIVGGTLIDGSGQAPVPDAHVIVLDGLVHCAGAAADCPISEGTRVLDASGRWLIPGLVDTHIHWQIWFEDARNPSLSPEAAARAARIYLANGITTVVDTGGSPWVTPEVRGVLDALAVSHEPAPRMLFSGWINRRTVDATESKNAGLLASELLAAGADGIKIRNGLTVGEYEEIVAAAARFGRPVYGHTYYQGDREFIDYTAEAAAAGVNGVLHVLGIPPVPQGARPMLPDVPMDDWEAWWVAGANLWSYATEESVDELIAVMTEHDVWLQPTLVTEQFLIAPDDYRDDPRWVHSPATHNEMTAGGPVLEGERLEQYRAAYRQMERFVRRFHGAGGMLVAGTDGLPIPGFGLHDELRLLAEAGVPEHAVLESATRNAAIAWGWQDRIGTIEPGKAADLVILDGDPLESIDNTSRPWRVVAGGVILDPADLLSDSARN